MDIVENIKKAAASLGACGMASESESVEDIARMFFKPQGREFCMEHGFPDMDTFRELKSVNCSDYGVFVDYGQMSAHDNSERLAFIGNTQADVWLSGTDNRHIVMLMHGASATLHLKGGAVVRVERTPGCEVNVINEDKEGGVVLW